MAEPTTTHPPTHYDILGVRPTASPQQIRRAFRDRSKLYHPDTTELPAAEATAKFQQLNEAYAILSSPDRRWSYDKQVGYSRISVMQPLEPLSRSQTTTRRKDISNLYLDPNDRPLSAGEIFALFILGVTFVACLALVLTIGFTRSETALNPLDTIAPEAVESAASEPQAIVPTSETEPKPVISADNPPATQQPAPRQKTLTPEAPASEVTPSTDTFLSSQSQPLKAPPINPVWL
jgi:hypothetical protein